jgi:hypothetical protein
VEWLGFMARNILRSDEVIVPVLAPPAVLAGIAWQGMEPVFADLDSETMSLTPTTVVNQVTVHTKCVYVTPVEGVIGNWEALRSVTEPRGIQLQIEGQGVQAKWEKIAPGIKGMSSTLLQIDSQLIHGGAAAFGEELSKLGLTVKRMPEWRGKRRDFPGMAAIEDQVLVLEDWRDHLELLQYCAKTSARQQQFSFVEPRRLPGSAGRDNLPLRRAV